MKISGISICMLIARAQRPQPVSMPDDEGDGADNRDFGPWRVRSDLDGERRDQREAEACEETARLDADGRGEVADAGGDGPERRHLPDAQVEQQRTRHRHRHHARGDAQPVEDVLTDEIFEQR